jgi:hypothetical protein
MWLDTEDFAAMVHRLAQAWLFLFTCYAGHTQSCHVPSSLRQCLSQSMSLPWCVSVSLVVFLACMAVCTQLPASTAGGGGCSCPGGRWAMSRCCERYRQCCGEDHGGSRWIPSPRCAIVKPGSRRCSTNGAALHRAPLQPGTTLVLFAPSLEVL